MSKTREATRLPRTFFLLEFRLWNAIVLKQTNQIRLP
jgi:hypothetical protein